MAFKKPNLAPAQLASAETGGRPSSKGSGGRPTAYRAEFARLGYELCLLGATDSDLARCFEVQPRTIDGWKKAHPNFWRSLKEGKETADARVADRLYQRAMGYEHEDVQVFYDSKKGEPVIVPVVKHYPPDTTACIFWLKNRVPDKWRDVQRHEHSGPGGKPIETAECSAEEIRKELARRNALPAGLVPSPKSRVQSH
jgi:hypothetical protein